MFNGRKKKIWMNNSIAFFFDIYPYIKTLEESLFETHRDPFFHSNLSSLEKILNQSTYLSSTQDNIGQIWCSRDSWRKMKSKRCSIDCVTHVCLYHGQEDSKWIDRWRKMDGNGTARNRVIEIKRTTISRVWFLDRGAGAANYGGQSRIKNNISRVGVSIKARIPI